MATHLHSALDYVRTNFQQSCDELVSWCAIPSISSLPAHESDMQRAAEWTAERLRHAGLQDVTILLTEGHPAVYGEFLGGGPQQPTILVYGHYDVQPALDTSLWESPPFEPQQRGDYLFARGVSDMKGQALASIAAVEAHLQTGALPVNVKFLIEGEEEIMSPNLLELIRQERRRLTADYSLNNDSLMIAEDQPNIHYGLRGGVRVRLTIFGPSGDVHSGLFGGTIHNPGQALSELIAGMHDQDGFVLLPGFYDRVRELSPEEHSMLARLPMDEKYFLKATGAPALWGESGFTPFERTTVRPTLEVLAMQVGSGIEGAPNIVPSRATAVLGMRLVPDQEPQECYLSLQRYLQAHVGGDIRWELTYEHGDPPTLMNRNHPGMQAAYRALETTWGGPPLLTRMGGGIAAVSLLEREMGLPTILIGAELPDSNIHGPNERLHLPTWRRNLEATTRFFLEARQG